MKKLKPTDRQIDRLEREIRRSGVRKEDHHSARAVFWCLVIAGIAVLVYWLASKLGG